MSKAFRSFAAISMFVALLVTGCGTSSNTAGTGTSGQNSVVVSKSIIAVGDASHCDGLGGITVNAGIDDNGNSVLDASEVDTTQYVCNGKDGANGTNGTNGADGTNGTNGTAGANGSNGTNGASVTLAVEPAGVNCANGGTKVSVAGGTPPVAYVCNGADLTAALKAEQCLFCHSASSIAPIKNLHKGLNAPEAVTATIDNILVTSASGSVTLAIDFTVKNAAGNEIVGLDAAAATTPANLGHLRFNIVKLIPGASLTAGDTNQWWPVGSSERTKARLTNNGGGSYSYTTASITTSGTITSTKYDSTMLTRVVLLVVPVDNGVALATLAQAKNANYDITNGSIATKDVVRTVNCLECHERFGESFHAGEGRVTAENCVACHYQSRGSNPTGSAEIGSFVHKIHTAQVAGSHDFTEVTYPQDIRNCTKCHKGGADSDNWKTKPTIAICTSCHSTISFVSPAPAGMTLHSGGAKANNAQCADCHVGTGDNADIANAHVAVADPDPDNTYSGGTNANTNAAYLAATGVVPAGADQITYVISSVSVTNNRPSITFKLQDNGSDVVFSAPSSTAQLMANFVGSPSVYFAWAVPQDGITAPADFNASASGYIKNIKNGTATGTGAGTMTGPVGGYYTITLTGVTVPANAVMFTGGVGYTYSLTSTQPLTQINLPAYPYNAGTKVGGLIVPAPNVWKVGTGYKGRRVIVDNAKCNKCHDGLGAAPTFHAGQRNDSPTCSFCHTPNRTSSGWSANASTFVHGIHGASKRTVPFNWHAVSATQNYSEVTYPGTLSNCEQCHVADGYDFAGSMYTAAQGVENMLYSYVATGTLASSSTSSYAFSPYVTLDMNYGSGFSFNAGTGVTTPAAGTTLVTSPITAACIACHDSTAEKGHMTGNGGSFYEKRANAIK